MLKTGIAIMTFLLFSEWSKRGDLSNCEQNLWNEKNKEDAGIVHSKTLFIESHY